MHRRFATCAAFAMLLVPSSPLTRFNGHPTHLTLIGNVDMLAPQLRYTTCQAKNDILHLLQTNLTCDRVCVPWDIRWYHVTMAPWWAFDLIGDNTFLHEDHMKASTRAQSDLQIQRQPCHTSRTLPIHSHVGISGKSMNSVRAARLQHTSIREGMSQHPFCFVHGVGTKWLY